jgi:TP901 family phage tail tape measure protein
MDKYEFFISLRDSVSGGLDKAFKSFKNTQTAAYDFNKSVASLDGSLGSIKKRIDDLKVIQELTTDMKELAAANRQIAGLEKQVNKLQNAGKGGRFEGLKNFVNELPGGSALTALATPQTAAIAAVAAIGGTLVSATQKAMDFDKGLAKVNTTLGLSRPELNDLGKELLGFQRTSTTTQAEALDAFNQIVSGVGELGASKEIFRTSLKAAEAYQTDIKGVSDAIVNTVNAVGRENISASRATDILAKAVNLGKGEFTDFAAYLPRIVPGAKNLGVSFEETAAAFAFFTSKGNSAERTSTLLENAINTLGDPKKRENLAKLGISVFDSNGKMRGFTNIVGDLAKKYQGATEKQSALIGGVLNFDKDAGQAFSSAAQDLGTLNDFFLQIKDNANGSLSKAFNDAQTPANEMLKIQNEFNAIMTELGIAILPTINEVLKFTLNTIRGIRDAYNNNPFFKGIVEGAGKAIEITSGFGFIKGINQLFSAGKKEGEAKKEVQSKAIETGDRNVDIRQPAGKGKKPFNPFLDKQLNQLTQDEKSKTESVTGGGSRPVNISIKFDTLNEGGITISTTNLTEGVANIEKMMTEMLLRVVNGANQIAI